MLRPCRIFKHILHRQDMFDQKNEQNLRIMVMIDEKINASAQFGKTIKNDYQLTDKDSLLMR